MENEMSRLQILGQTMTRHGQEIVIALIMLISGLLIARWVHNSLSKGMRKLNPDSKIAPLACNSMYIIIIAITIMGTAVELGAEPVVLFRLVAIIVLIIIGIMVFLRPLLPTMPFKVGNYVKAGVLMGKVEAITFLNTRLKTFDGKTFFVPNRQILNEIVINYHFTQTRRIKIDITIRYDQDLLKAKRVLEMIMIEDPRVKLKPSAAVYVMDLAANSVNLGGRCWVDNMNYWFTRCDLLEKTKLRFDREGIKFAFPQLDVHMEPYELQVDEFEQSIENTKS